jgi:hypothetical protein
MDAQTSAMFFQLMAQNQQLMTQLMSQQNANNIPIKSKKTHKSLDDLVPITFIEFIDDFDFLPLDSLTGFSLPDFYAQNIINNLNKYDLMERPIQLIDKKRKKISYINGNKWESNEEWFTSVYKLIFKHYCAKFATLKKSNNFKHIHEANDMADDKDIDEIQCLIGKFYDVTKYPFAFLKEKTINRLVNKMEELN